MTKSEREQQRKAMKRWEAKFNTVAARVPRGGPRPGDGAAVLMAAVDWLRAQAKFSAEHCDTVPCEEILVDAAIYVAKAAMNMRTLTIKELK
jgi:hypothetical protein